MINKINNRIELFGLALKDEYVLLNRENEVVKHLHDGDILFENTLVKWTVSRNIKENGTISYVLLLWNNSNDTIKQRRALPNRKTILWNHNNSALCPFMYMPEGKTKLQKFLIKNGIYDFNTVINYCIGEERKLDEAPYEISWIKTVNEEYPYKIKIYTNNPRVDEYIIKELVK